MSQKYQKGDLVHVAKDLGQSMSHFTADIDAIVIGSYNDQYGGGDRGENTSYTLHLKGRGECSWYYERQLELIERGRIDLLDQWAREKKVVEDRCGDIDWIFANGPEVAENPHGASIAKLGRCLGIDNMWGARGEGITYYTNAIGIMAYATPFLLAKDKAGFLAYSGEVNGGAK